MQIFAGTPAVRGPDSGGTGYAAQLAALRPLGTHAALQPVDRRAFGPPRLHGADPALDVGASLGPGA